MEEIKKIEVQGQQYGVADMLMRSVMGGNTQTIEWSDSHNMNDYKDAGTYRIKGERTGNPMDDNLPIMNQGSGHTIDGVLYVLDSSLTNGSGKESDCTITQFLMLSNRVGGQEGDMYMRSAYGSNKSSLTWKPWEKYSTNMEVGVVSNNATHEHKAPFNPISANGLNSFVDNGIYSGVYLTQEVLAGDTTKTETFVMITINNYAAAGDNKTITQIKFAVATNGTYSQEYRTLSSDGFWSEWNNEMAALTIVNNLTDGGADRALSAEMGKKLNSKMTPFISKLTGTYNSSDYKGIYCQNVNNGNVFVANDTGNGIVIPVKEGEVYEIGGNLKYGSQSAQFYNGYPSLNTNVANVYIRNNKVTVPQGATYMLISVNPSLETETTIKQLNWMYIEDLPQSYKESLDNTKEQINSLKEVVGSVVEIPVNNKNIKNWNTANKLVTRLYVENKEQALTDGLFIRQFFRALNSSTNNGFNFGTRTTDWAVTIAPKIGDFDYYETTHPPYGKIAIKIADWDAIEWPSNGVINIGALSESNLEDVVFNWNEFIKPLYPIATIADGSVTENKLSEEVKDKLNSSAPPLSRYELFSLGDSLSASGVWQTKVAELTGCVFDQGKNNKGGAMLSVGGTLSYGDNFDNVLWRTKNLIDQNYITDDGKNTIVILENVNDGYQVFTGEDKTIIPTTPIEGYNDSEFDAELLSSIADKAQLNAVLRLNKVVAGKNLRIDTLPTKSGTITLRVGWAGPGYSNYNIYVEPQATDEETLKFVLDKILEYSYTGITDVLNDDGVSIDFSSGNSDYLPTIQFTDTDKTGMTVTVTDNPNAKGSIARYFIGDSINEWTDISKWQKGITYSQGWKSAIEMLQRAYPKLHIFISMFPMHSVTASEYLLPNGTYDTAAYNQTSRMNTMRKMQVELNNIAKFYSLPFLDVFAECGIGISNMLTYYNAQANVHPKNEGYYRFGETVAIQLRRFLI